MSSFLLTNIRIFDGESTIPSGNVLISNGKISKISTSPIDFDGPIFSKPGHTLLPGLIDVHIHADKANPAALPQSLRFGVTTVCDMHNEVENIIKLREQAKGGDCADLKTTSFAATIDNGWPEPVVTAHDESEETLASIATWPKLVTPADGQQYVRDRLLDNVDYIKLMHESGSILGADFTKPALELQRAIIDEAHSHGLKVVAHAMARADTLEVLAAGVDGLTHQFIDAVADEEVVQAYLRNSAHVNPTLSAMGSLTKEGEGLQRKFAEDERVKGMLGFAERERLCCCMGMANVESARVTNAFESVKILKAKGVDVLCGSDAASPAVGTAWGLSMHQELSLLVNECDFTPAEALRSATYLPAKRFDFVDRGEIKEGLRADLVLVEGNPMEDIDCTLNLRGVWTKGELTSAHEGKL